MRTLSLWRSSAMRTIAVNASADRKLGWRILRNLLVTRRNRNLRQKSAAPTESIREFAPLPVSQKTKYRVSRLEFTLRVYSISPSSEVRDVTTSRGTERRIFLLQSGLHSLPQLDWNGAYRRIWRNNLALTNVGMRVPPLEFFDLVHENKDCASQNAFALLYMIPQPPDPHRKRRPKISGRRERMHVQYTVRKADNSRVQVCARSFISITGIGKTTKLSSGLTVNRSITWTRFICSFFPAIRIEKVFCALHYVSFFLNQRSSNFAFFTFSAIFYKYFVIWLLAI